MVIGETDANSIKGKLRYIYKAIGRTSLAADSETIDAQKSQYLSGVSLASHHAHFHGIPRQSLHLNKANEKIKEARFWKILHQLPAGGAVGKRRSTQKEHGSVSSLLFLATSLLSLAPFLLPPAPFKAAMLPFPNGNGNPLS